MRRIIVSALLLIVGSSVHADSYMEADKPYANDRSTEEFENLVVRLQNSDGFYFMGSRDRASQLDQSLNFQRIDKAGWSKLDKSQSKILLVDEQAPLDEKFLKGVVESGNFLIAVGNTKRIKAVTEPEGSVNLVAKDSQGYIKGETGYGFYVSPKSGVIHMFYTTEPDPTTTMMLTHEWALDMIDEEKGASGTRSTRLHPAWAEKLQRHYTTNNDFQPYGRLNIRTTYYQLTDDGSSTNDWWTLEYQTEAIPGVHLYNQFLPAYKTYWIESVLDADDTHSNFVLQDYDPSITDSSCSSSIGVSMVGGGMPASWSYDCKSAGVYNYSDYSQEKMDIYHLWHTTFCTACRYPITVKPGSVVTVPQGTWNVWNDVYEYHKYKAAAGPGVSQWYAVWWQ